MIRSVVVGLLELYVAVLFVRALLSWFPPPMPGSHMANFTSLVFRLTEPVLGPVRRLLPPVRAGGMGIDLSFILVFFALQFLVIPAVSGLL